MASSKKADAPEEKVELYERVLATQDTLDRKGAKMPYTSLNGHMTSFLNADGVMGLRLSNNDREKFMSDHNTELMVQHGSTMKEFVSVPDGLLQNTEALAPYVQNSIDYVGSLKPKATKKK